MSEKLSSAVYALLDWINSFAQITYPGTNLPIIVVLLSPLAVVIVWKFLIKRLFGVNDE